MISLIRKNNIKVNKKCAIRIKSGGIVCAGAMSCGPSGQTIDRRHKKDSRTLKAPPVDVLSTPEN
jgi:hypothetical protein